MALNSPGHRAVASALYSSAIIAAVAYFSFAALQGEYGLTRLIEIRALEVTLEADLAAMQAERAALENKTRRLSDAYLDLDLLDEQARKLLGLARTDEIVVR